MITLDFETEGIEGNPLVHPPKPVGLAVQVGDAEPYYHTDWDKMVSTYRLAVNSEHDLLFHNAPFDTRVAEEWFGIPMPEWDRIHDTMYLVYLADPYAPSLSLKPSAERWLGEPPEEQDVLKDWILRNVPGAKPSNFGYFISYAPVDIVEPYAKGDVHRTFALFEKLRPAIPTEAYDRERRLMPILVRSSQRGILIAREALGQAIESCSQALEQADQQLRVRLGVPGLNPGSGPELGRALVSAGLLGANPIRTPTGKIKVAKDTLALQITDSEMLSLIRYRQTLQTCLGNHMKPWFEMSEEDGRVHAEWNQVRNTDRGKQGTRTGRLSCARPNLQNPPTEFDFAIPPGFDLLPVLRRYFLPEDGHFWIKRDFSSQEIRIAAHFEGGALMDAYVEDPQLDPHEMARQLILQHTGKEFERKHVKIVGFQIIYGGGGPAISASVGCSLQEAYDLKEAYLSAMPGIRQLSKTTKKRGSAGRSVRTWGGREYYTEPPKNGRSFEYKLLNYLIQGSAADQTKQCINKWDDIKEDFDVFLATVHDEINISVPEDRWKASMKVLQEAMEEDMFDVPMRSEGFKGWDWGSLTSTGGQGKGYMDNTTAGPGTHPSDPHDAKYRRQHDS